MVSSDPYHGTGPSSARVKHRRSTPLTTHATSGSGAQVTSSKLARGTQGRYHTRELLGRGGMSEVYRGFDVRLRRPVAIKRLRSDAANNPVFRARFRREAEAAGRLHHSAIVAIYDTGEEHDTTGRSIPFIVMELIEGCSLREELHEAGKIPVVRALEVTAAVLDALACSHAAGIIHRDVKPANVMLSNTGEIKVADFGIARPAAETTGTVTLAGTVLGTPQYLSPEQGRGEPVDERSDLYSVGCMLFELLVGAPPFGGDSPLSIVVQHISNAPSSPSAVNADISGDIDSIVLKALAKDPADRYQTASEMKADIESVLSGNRPAATALLEAPTVELSRPPGSHVARTDRVKATHVLAVVTAVLFVVVGASAFSVYRSSPPVTATHGSTEVPAVLGLGKVGARSLLRNARLVPRFELVHGPDGESVGTVIKQSPDGGDAVDTDSTVLVVINIGPSPDDPNLTYPERTNRRPTEPLSVRSSDTFRPHIDSESPADARTAQGDTSTGTQPSPAGDSGGKSEKGKKHGKSG
jgi:eukaryotic-like serine/threonine-protein kinase